MPRPRPTAAARRFANGQNFREVGLHQCPSERKGEGVPVRRLRVPSHVPSQPQTAAKVRGFSPIASGFTAETDWLLERTRFELAVPPRSRARLAGRAGRFPAGRARPTLTMDMECAPHLSLSRTVGPLAYQHPNCQLGLTRYRRTGTG